MSIHTEVIAKVEHKKYVYDIPDELQKYPYLTLENEILEFGYDHWINFQWMSLTPYDGFSFSLKCEDDLIIKQHTIFDDNDAYNVSNSIDHKTMSILSTEWLNEYTGFSIVVGAEDKRLDFE